MGLFFNYDKPGKGIEKDAPKKKGLFLYIEMFFGKIKQLFKTNLLYSLVSLPVLLVYYFILDFGIRVMLADVPDVNTTYLSLMATIIVGALWGTGPICCGFSHNLQKYAWDEHVFEASDFFIKIKENLKHGLLFILFDIIALIVLPIAIFTYSQMALMGSKGALVPLCFIVFMTMMYTFSHFFIYQLTITFRDKLWTIYKNAFMLVVATIPMCLFFTIFAVACTYYMAAFLAPLAIILVTILIWMVFLRFPIEFYVARLIKRRFLDNEESEK